MDDQTAVRPVPGNAIKGFADLQERLPSAKVQAPYVDESDRRARTALRWRGFVRVV
jgi:hypothetical protein